MPPMIKDIAVFVIPILAIGALLYNIIATRITIKNDLGHLRESLDGVIKRIERIEGWIFRKADE